MDLPKYELRAATPEHLADVCALARHLNTVNLPDDPVAVRALLETSERSFSGDIADPFRREYVFVLWDIQAARVLGTSMIVAQLGRRDAPYIYLEVRTEEKYSATLDRHFAHRVLTTRYSYEGPTEIGGLVMHPESRRSRDRLGTLISYVRFLFIAMQRSSFRAQLLAELLPPLLPDGTSHLWEAYGRRFTGLSYRDADQLSRRNKEFIRSLFPDDIYATLLSEDAQRVIGEVGAETRGVEKMLRRIGFEYAQRVDPFDGGPHFLCDTARVSLIRAARATSVRAVSCNDIDSRVGTAAVGGSTRAGTDVPDIAHPHDTSVPAARSPSVGSRDGSVGVAGRALLGCIYPTRPYFRAVPIAAPPGEGEIGLPQARFQDLDLASGGSTWVMPLP